MRVDLRPETIPSSGAGGAARPLAHSAVAHRPGSSTAGAIDTCRSVGRAEPSSAPTTPPPPPQPARSTVHAPYGFYHVRHLRVNRMQRTAPDWRTAGNTTPLAL